MTDDLPFLAGDAPGYPVTPRRCRRHQWGCVTYTTDDGYRPTCIRCGKVRDEAAAVRGRRARIRGKSIERAEMRRAGRHTGNAGGADDGLSEDGLFAFQSKSRVTARFPSWQADELDKLRAARSGKTPVLVVIEAPGPGRRARKLAILEWSDWLALHGGDR